MARKGKRNRKGGLQELIEMPWRVSVMLAVVFFVCLRWIVPALIPASTLFGVLRPILETLSWIVLCGFGAAAALAALHARVEAARQVRHAEAAQAQHARQAALDAMMPRPAAWSLEALRQLEWKRIELLCARYYEAAGFRTETQATGPDGGIDVKLYKNDPIHPIAIVQCKAWNTRPVGVKEVRELLGVMAHVKVARGIVVSTGGYSQDALAFGAANPIQLLDGQALVDKLLQLAPAQQAALLASSFEGDYRTPTCPSCGVKLRERSGKRASFWGCKNYPRCKTLIPVARESAQPQAAVA